ncbi:G protein [Cytorhabdovirus hordei]|uniref:G protein n=1 Tax=Cytorhabdovirus hordei TaxID=1985699 RepID=A0A0C5KR43_9RHAB|nr:G protein [Cytorhabdovirus hordei]AJP67522.1 G protein [Cytorhabdovirus hordei]
MFRLLLVSVLTGQLVIAEAFSVLSCNQTEEQPSVLQCLQSCDSLKTGRHVGIDIMKHDASTIIQVAKCTWIVEERAFTETWTFSRFASEVTRSYSPASSFECRGMFNNHCKKRSGCISGDVPIDPVYSWARTEIRRSKFLHIETVNATAYPYEKKGMIIIKGKSIPISNQEHIEGDVTYVWDQVEIGNDCPWSNNTETLSCHYQGELEEHIVCPGEGIVLWNTSLLQTGCNWKIYKDSTGIIFRKLENSTADWYPNMIETGGEALKVLTNGIRYSLRVRDSFSCLQNCGNLDKGLVFIGGYYYYRGDQRCKLVNGCTINKYTFSCNNGRYIWTRCYSESAWIDMERAELIKNPTCDRDHRKRLSKDEAEKAINKYHNTSKLFSVLNLKVMRDVELKEGESTEIARVLRTNATLDSETKEDNIFLSFHPWEMFKELLGHIQHEIKVMLFTGVSLYVGYKLYTTYRGRSSSKPSELIAMI